MIIEQNVERFIKDIGVEEESDKQEVRDFFFGLNVDFEEKVKTICPDAKLGLLSQNKGPYMEVRLSVNMPTQDQFIEYRATKAFRALCNEYQDAWQIIESFRESQKK